MDGNNTADQSKGRNYLSKSLFPDIFKLALLT